MNMDRIPAYELILKEEISDIHSEGYLLKHKKSGARVMVLKNEDENKVFNMLYFFRIFTKRKKFSVRRVGIMSWKMQMRLLL